MTILLLSVLGVSLIGLLRLVIYRLGSDLYLLLNPHLHSHSYPAILPSISIIIPAHNEAATIVHTLTSLSQLLYPSHLLQVIVAVNGSTDATVTTVNTFNNTHPSLRLTLLNLPQPGKAEALNYALDHYATGDLIVTLDADSTLSPDSLLKAVPYFQDQSTVALGANIKVIPQPGFIHLIQTFEYLLAFQMKRAHHAFNTEYIVSGAAAFYRRQFIASLGFFACDTCTEDMDLSVRIIGQGNQRHRLVFAADVIAHTQVPQTFQDLIRQRFRWKYGRNQTFYKHRHLLLTRIPHTNPLLNRVFIPLNLFYDLILLFEPLIILTTLYLALIGQNPLILLSGITVVTLFLWLNVLAEDSVSFKDKLVLLFIAPTMYFYLYLMNLIELVALIKTLAHLHRLPKSLHTNYHPWVHPQRALT